MKTTLKMSVIEPECQQQQNENAINAEQQQERDFSRIEEEQRAANDEQGIPRNELNSPEDTLMTEDNLVALKEEDMKDEEQHQSLKDELEAVLNERQELIQRYLILQKLLNSLKISDTRNNP